MKGTFPTERFKNLRTPFYYYDMDLLRRTLEEIRHQLQVLDWPAAQVHYAIKANHNPVILNYIARFGFGADCVSGGEVQAALEAGFDPKTIFYAGVGKADWEIQLGLDAGIGRFNVESTAELHVLAELAAASGKVAPISLRVNPDVAAHTHKNITTGLAENKFGIHYSILEDVIREAQSLPSIEFIGLHYHIGSQILDLEDFRNLCHKNNQIVHGLQAHGIEIKDINVGGGLGIEYNHPNRYLMADFAGYFQTYSDELNTNLPIHFELGRSIVAPCGSLISRVLYVKEGLEKEFAILDAGMNDLLRPALYHAQHRIENLTSEEDLEPYDVVGPVCESSDVFGEQVMLNKCHRGDLIAIRSAGAYGQSMASQYNCRPLAPSVFSTEY